MASSVDFIEFVADQIRDTGIIHYKKMFGEYMVYVNDKPLLLVCDDTVFVKKIDALSEIMQEADSGFPYKGAKEHYILDIENVELSKVVISIIEPLKEVPKPKKKKTT